MAQIQVSMLKDVETHLNIWEYADKRYAIGIHWLRIEFGCDPARQRQVLRIDCLSILNKLLPILMLNKFCRRKKPNLQGYGPPSEVPISLCLRFEVSCIASGSGGFKCPNEFEDFAMTLKWESLGEFFKPGDSRGEMHALLRFCLWCGRVQVEGLASCVPCGPEVTQKMKPLKDCLVKVTPE